MIEYWIETQPRTTGNRLWKIENNTNCFYWYWNRWMGTNCMNWKNHMEQWHDHEYHKMSEEEIFLEWL